MSDPQTVAAVLAVKRLTQQAVNPHRAYRVEGRGLLDGRAVVRRDGEAADDEQTYARILPGVPTPGLDAVMLNVSGVDVHLGNIYQGAPGELDIGVGLLTIIPFSHSQTAADNSPTSSTATFVDIITVSVVLPGTGADLWDVDILDISGCNLLHSTGASVDRRVALNATGGPESGATMQTTFEHYHFPGEVYTVAGGDTYTARLQYKMSAAGGSASARAPGILVLASRVS